MCSVPRASCSVIAAHTCERDGRAASLEYHISIFHSRSVRGMLRQCTDSIIAPSFCSDLSKKLTSSPGVSHPSFLLRYLRMVYEERTVLCEIVSPHSCSDLGVFHDEHTAKCAHPQSFRNLLKTFCTDCLLDPLCA